MDNQSNSIKLPILVINKILSYLSLRDRYKLKLICKEWKYLIERHLQIRLIICESDYIFKTKFNDYDILVINRNFDFNSLFQLKLIQNLKYLYIDYVDKDCYETIYTNLIDNLKELRIFKLNNIGFVINNLNLPHLISLEFDNSYSSIAKCDCPKLKNLVVNCHVNFKFKHPESIIFLNCFYMKDNYFKLENLEHLITDYFDFKFINRFPKLKKLELIAMDSLDNLSIEQIRRIKNLEIFVNGFKYPDHIYLFKNQRTKDYIHINAANLKLILDNYSNLKSKINCKTYLSYTDQIPDFIIDHFTNIQAIFVVGKINQLNLTKFLKNCKTFNHLFLETNSLNQNFYDQLPTFKTIKYLKISTSNKGIKFNFITEFGHLLILYLSYYRIPIKSIRETFKVNKFFKEFNFAVFKEMNVCDYNQDYIYLDLFSLDLQLTRRRENKIHIYGQDGEKDLDELESSLKKIISIKKYLIDK